jgi:cysteine desulfurase/selenocysteine lyase
VVPGAVPATAGAPTGFAPTARAAPSGSIPASGGVPAGFVPGAGAAPIGGPIPPIDPWTNTASLADPFSALPSTLARLSAADLVHPELPSLPLSSLPSPSPSLFSVPSVPSVPSLPSLPPPWLPSSIIEPSWLPGMVPAGPPPTSTAPSFYFLDNASPSGAVRPTAGHPAFDVHTIRRDFPILQERVHGRQLVWFDNAATTQKPSAVIERLSHFYRHENSNIHRAAHELAARATDAYESARRQVQRFLGAASHNEIVFVRGATEAINLVAQTWGRKNIGEGDEILISHLEHHANIVPWQMLAAERGAKLKVVPVNSRGELRLDELQRLLNSRTKLVSITHVSNALGTVTPIQEIVDLGHRAGACVLIDGAQSVSHIPINVQAFDADFFVLSGHKVFGPTGIGVLYGKAKVLEDMPPWQGGGNMIEDVTFEATTYQPPPGRFEAGTGNIADAVGLGAALEYLTTIGMPNIEYYETELLGYATECLGRIPGLEIIGTAPHKASVLSFVIEGIEPTAIGTALNQEGIAVRAGHHCAQPILRRFGLEATVRASLAFYNTFAEIDAMTAVLHSLTASSARRAPGTRNSTAR